MNQILTIATFIIGLLTFVIAYIVYFNNSKGDVVVYAKVDMSRQGIILLIIHNIGKGIAQDIKFSGTDFILKNVLLRHIPYIKEILTRPSFKDFYYIP